KVELVVVVAKVATGVVMLVQLILLARDSLRRLHVDGIPMNSQLEIALIVEGHGGQLSEGVFTVEHPAVGPREQRVRDVADALLEGGVRLGRRPRALNPLALEVVGNLAAAEGAVTRSADGDLGSWNVARRIEEPNPLAVPG